MTQTGPPSGPFSTTTITNIIQNSIKMVKTTFYSEHRFKPEVEYVIKDWWV